MMVRQIRVGTMQNFVYLVADESSGEAMAVDSGWDTDPIVRIANDEGMKVRFAVATHNHSDHTSTLRELAQKVGARVVAHKSSPITHDVPVTDGATLRVGGKTIIVLHTPGHTEDSICLHDGENLFTGDTLFIGNCGRTDLPGGSPEKMYRSLHQAILRLPPETTIYPGHDYGEVPFRKLSEESKLNPTLSAKSYAEFLRIP
jgi:glyoxylase-like metal-dependent hydrolase (beta-lactamase superfamily II)